MGLEPPDLSADSLVVAPLVAPLTAAQRPSVTSGDGAAEERRRRHTDMLQNGDTGVGAAAAMVLDFMQRPDTLPGTMLRLLLLVLCLTLVGGCGLIQVRASGSPSDIDWSIGIPF
jgi:hypothetical protein